MRGGGIILSNRLRAMQEAAENFGESVAGTREAQRKAKMETEDRAAMAKSRAIQDRAGEAQATAAEMTLQDFKGRQAAKTEAEGLAGQIQDFGQAVPDSTIEAEGALPGFQREQSMRPVGDTTAQALQDRIRASWMNADARAKGETSAFTAADVQKKRAEEMETKAASLAGGARKKETEDRAYALDERKVKVQEREAAAKEKEATQKVTGQKPLSGDAAKVKAIATTMIPEIQKLQEKFRTDYKKSLSGFVSGTDRELVKLIDQIADKVGRLRSGGAVNKDEEARFKKQLGSTMDIMFGNSEDAIGALDGLLGEAGIVLQGIEPNAEVPSSIRRPAAKVGRFQVEEG